jgi:hypothetical protein
MRKVRGRILHWLSMRKIRSRILHWAVNEKGKEQDSSLGCQ